MKLGLRVFIGYFLVLGISALFLLHWIEKEMSPLVRQASEETLVETAYALAATIQPSFTRTGTIDPLIAESLLSLSNTLVNANIWGVPKQNLTLQIYITDINGIVLFDSKNKQKGENFSRWNDVYLTLSGKYGVRSTRTDPENPNTSIMYVAAPIKNRDKIVGVLTVAFPNENIRTYLSAAAKKLTLYGTYTLLISLLVGMIFTGWLIYSLRRISAYAEHASDRNSKSPDFAKGTELEKLTLAISHMRDELEGKNLLENYVTHFTHELKSPLSAIRASNELLADNAMSDQQRTNFVASIDRQCEKLQQLTDRLLQLVRLEKKRQLDQTCTVDMDKIIRNEIEALRYLAGKRGLEFICKHRIQNVNTGNTILGDPLLLAQAVHNLLENALQFADSGSVVEIECGFDQQTFSIDISNQGPSIPDFALRRLGERFYSLPHPDGSRGTGLGLAFVYEIVNLHQGMFSIHNTSSGVRSTITLHSGK